MTSRALFPAAAFLSLLTFLFSALPIASTAQNTKLAQVSVDKIYKNSARIKAAVEDMKKIETETAPRLNSLKAEAEKIEERLSAAKDTLKPEEREKLQQEYAAKRDEAQALQQALRAKLTLKQRSAENAVKADIKEIVAKIAKEEGFSAVFMSESLVYSGGTNDITDRVLKELDARPALEGAPK